MKAIFNAITYILITLAPIAGLTHATTHTATAATTLSDGEIRKVDKEAKKLTIRHGPLHNLDMPAMTMVFQVWDTTILDALAIGDKIKFVAEKKNGAYVVTHVETSK